jgi:enoyl-CoA hydratase
MTQLETLELERREGFTIVRLDRPPVNAVNRQMMYDLRATFDELSQDRSINAVVLSARGDKVFCGGIDLKDNPVGNATADDDQHELLDPTWLWRQVQHSVHECLVPVVAAVEKPCIGAGFGLIGVSDLVIAGEEATFGLTEINVGLLGGASKAIRLLGPSKGRRMLFLGEMIPAAELYRLGGIEELVAPGGAEARAIEIAEELATKSPIALRLAKQSILRIEGGELMQRYHTENDYTDRLRRYDDAKEAIAAYTEKRPPEWTWS